MSTITTPNLLEVAYLLERHHQITQVATQTAWPYGIEELAVTLAGENIELDHANFLRHGKTSLGKLPKALSAIQSAVAQAVEGGAA